MFSVTHRYESRPIRFLELLERDGWRLKIYSIVHGSAPLHRAIYADGIELAFHQLPRPAATAHRPGVGFVICHQGNGWNYLVTSWWDSENELPQLIHVRPIDDRSASWTRATESQSVCVWDIQLINFERDAYVRHVLSPNDPNLDAYLSARFAV